MATVTSFQTLVTPAPRLHSDLLIRRQNGDTICGDLNSAYPNVQAPTCTGATSICTFSQNLQGCCDDNNSCQFYTTCIGHYDPATCTGSECLGCTDSAPYCIKYNFWDASSLSNYDGYSCGIFQDTSTVFGAATSSSVAAAAATTSPSTSSAAASSTASSASASSLSALPSSASRTSNLTETSSASTSSSPTATGVLAPESRSVSHVGAIAGSVVGGILGLALLGVGAWFVYKKVIRPSKTEESSRVGGTVPEVQQRYNV